MQAQVEDRRLLVCVPSAGSIPRDQRYDNEFMASHLFEPAPAGGEGAFVSLNGRRATVQRGAVTTGSGFPRQPMRVAVLFEETFFNAKDQSYRVLCLQHALVGNVASVAPGETLELRSLEAIDAFLHADAATADAVRRLETDVRTFTHSYIIVAGYEESAVQRLREMSKRCFEAIIAGNEKFRRWQKQAPANVAEIKAAVENYAAHLAHTKFFSYLEGVHGHVDERLLNMQIALEDNPSLITMSQLGIRSELHLPFTAAIARASQLDSVTTPVEKLTCFQHVFDAINKTDSSEVVGGDDLLPILVWVLLHSKIPDLHTNIIFIELLSSGDYAMSQLGFVLASVSAAVKYMSSDATLSRQFPLYASSTPRSGSQISKSVSERSFPGGAGRRPLSSVSENSDRSTGNPALTRRATVADGGLFPSSASSLLSSSSASAAAAAPSPRGLGLQHGRSFDRSPVIALNDVTDDDLGDFLSALRRDESTVSTGSGKIF